MTSLAVNAVGAELVPRLSRRFGCSAQTHGTAEIGIPRLRRLDFRRRGRLPFRNEGDNGVLCSVGIESRWNSLSRQSDDIAARTSMTADLHAVSKCRGRGFCSRAHAWHCRQSCLRCRVCRIRPAPGSRPCSASAIACRWLRCCSESSHISEYCTLERVCAYRRGSTLPPNDL